MLSHIIASLVSSSSLHIHGPPQRLNTSLRYDLCLRSESPASAKRANRTLSRGVGGARQRTTFPCLSNWVREVRTRRGLLHSLAVMFAALRAHYCSFVIAPSSSELGQHLCHLPACALTSLTHHPAPPDPTPSAHKRSRRWIRTAEMWHLMVSVINRMHTCNSLPRREPCCGFRGSDADGSHLVGADGPLWWLRTGYEHTHTDGDPLRVARRWTCWLLICSDQWFTTWSSVSGGPAPTELAQWRWHKGQTSLSAQAPWLVEVSAAFFLCPCPLLLAQNITKHFQTFCYTFFFTSMLLFVYLPITFISVDTFAGLHFLLIQLFFSLKICVENIMALQNQIVWLGHIDSIGRGKYLIIFKT